MYRFKKGQCCSSWGSGPIALSALPSPSHPLTPPFFPPALERMSHRRRESGEEAAAAEWRRAVVDARVAHRQARCLHHTHRAAARRAAKGARPTQLERIGACCSECFRMLRRLTNDRTR
eukprot:6179002-Pleurochrysis_carterae.AAC.3